MRESSIDPKWIGTKWGRLTVKGFSHDKRRHKYTWVCQCDCGNTVEVFPYHVKTGHTQSCGCRQCDRASEANTTHGLSNTRLFNIYNGMKNRCYNSNQVSYERYGARGIKICEEWFNDFSSFAEWALGNGYTENLSIDRIDNDGDYCPENCRWVTMKEQARNTSRNNMIEIGGIEKTLIEWCEELGINFHTVEWRIHVGGMTPQEALMKGVKKDAG